MATYIQHIKTKAIKTLNSILGSSKELPILKPEAILIQKKSNPFR